MNCQETISLTFSDQGENNVGMQLVGNMVPRGQGFNIHNLRKIQKKFVALGLETELYRLNDLYKETPPSDIIQEAYVLVIRQAIPVLLDGPKMNDYLLEEMCSLEWDNKYFCTRRRKVLNKHARTNLCFGNEAQEPDYLQKKGTIVDYQSVPHLSQLLSRLPEFIGEKGTHLVCEGNRYYNLKKCGIGWHGDKERRKVIAFRLGHSMNLCYHWFFNHKPMGKMLKLNLHHGDMYIMSEKAVGTDWSRSSIFTLRHCAGIDDSSYLKLKLK